MDVPVARLRVAWALAFGLLVTAPARADVDEDQFESAQWRVAITAPRNWQLTEQTSYPNVLLWMASPPDGRMLLSAETVARDDDALKYAGRTGKLLTAMGFKLRAPQLHSATGAFLVDFNNGKVYLRQAFLVIDGIGYSLTLSAPTARSRSQHLRAFDSALRSIRPMRKSEGDDKSGSPESDRDAGVDGG